ncbi:RidA family protein [Haladaptatus caseinilyticus]|uniref:RidA family protein n=1 Tax=Haladaptatus caseinilyticus TaxID=2993314 RepID=UPI00224B6116|nr:RidA family protein [Haladaptatus caseinilyticus]
MSDLEHGSAETTASSLAVITHHDDHRHVEFSGLAWPEDDTAPKQVRTLLEFLKVLLVDHLDGSMDDVTVTRFYIRESVLTAETRARIHEVRHEFFSLPHFPASTMVGVADLIDDGMLVELEVEARLPDGEWEVETMTLDLPSDE